MQRSLNSVLRDGNARQLMESERAIKYRNARQFVEIFFKSNVSMKRGLGREDTKPIIHKMMTVLASKNIGKKKELDEANRILAENIRAIKNNKSEKKKKDDEEVEMIDALSLIHI